MGLAVIGAGWGRTGTTSLQKALEILGFAPCHHMHEVMADFSQVPHWQAAVDGEPVDWNAVFEGYKSAVDWPASQFWRELSEYYPDSKVILTVRDPESWWRSFSRTILVNMQIPLEEMDDPERIARATMIRKLIGECAFGCAPDDKEAVLKSFQANIDEVQASLPPERLLTIDASVDWEKLCNFLDCPIPDEPYPFLNTTSQYTRDKAYLSQSTQD